MLASCWLQSESESFFLLYPLSSSCPVLLSTCEIWSQFPVLSWKKSLSVVSCYDRGSRLDVLHSRDAPLHTLLVTIGYLSYRCLLISSGVWSFFSLFWHQKSIFHPENSYFFLLKNTIAAHSYTEPVQCSVYGLFNKSEIHNSGSKG